MERNVPLKLYRGIVIDYEYLNNYDFNSDLKLNYEPLIDKYGRKIVKDGNEYGIYMSDNKMMVLDVYGNVHNEGTLISALKVNNRDIRIPKIGIAYEIDTNKLDVRKPFITEQLNGVYNNGYVGNEWITDSIPKENYKILRIRIGKDLIHDFKDIECSNSNDIKLKIEEEMNKRFKRILLLTSYLEKLPQFQLKSIDTFILTEIFGENGLIYTNLEDLDLTNKNDLIKYLKIKNGLKEEKIDFQALSYLNILDRKTSTIDDIVKIVETDKLSNIEKLWIFNKNNPGMSNKMLESKNIFYNSILDDSILPNNQTKTSKK